MKIHYRTKIEMTPVGHSVKAVGSDGSSLLMGSRDEALMLCELLNDSDIFCITQEIHAVPYVNIKKSLRGEFNRLIVAAGLSKPLNKSQFESSVMTFRTVRLDIIKRLIVSKDNKRALLACAELNDLVSQLQG